MSTCLTVNDERPSEAAVDHQSPCRLFLDVLHPDGIARRAGGLGAYASATSSDADGLDARDRMQECDAILLAPDTRECRAHRWLDEAAAAAGRLLAADGVVYLMAPRYGRGALLKRLAARGLAEDSTYIHLRYGSSAEYIARCDARAIDQLVTSVPIRRSRERLVRAAIGAVPAAPGWLRFAARRLGVALRREGARPLFEWATTPHTGGPCSVGLVRIKRREATATAVFWLFRDGGRSADFIVKRALTDSSIMRVHGELHALEQLGPAAARAGALLPTADLLARGDRFVRYPILGGAPADVLLAAHPARLEELVCRIASWLEAWNASTRRLAIVRARWVIDEVLAPARRVAPLLDAPDSYLHWLTGACERIEGRLLPTVATHGDLTMSNILVEDQPPLRIVDWESARQHGLPLADFCYAAADARAAIDRYRTRAQALVHSLDSRTDYGRFVARLATRIDGAVAGDPLTSRLLLHATALQHAANEQAKQQPGVQPFAALVRWLAGRELREGARPCT